MGSAGHSGGADSLTSTVSWKALAWSKAAWPMDPSMTKITCWGLTAANTGGGGHRAKMGEGGRARDQKRAGQPSPGSLPMPKSTPAASAHPRAGQATARTCRDLAHLLKQRLFLLVPTRRVDDDEVPAQRSRAGTALSSSRRSALAAQRSALGAAPSRIGKLPRHSAPRLAGRSTSHRADRTAVHAGSRARGRRQARRGAALACPPS
jgi:hypothetical protein